MSKKTRGKDKKRRNYGTTMKQKKSVDNILSGKFESKKDAMIDAGYSEVSAKNPAGILAKSRGVQKYLDQLSEKSRIKYDMSIEEKVMDTYYKGLSATKLYGKDAISHPDYAVRKSFADRMAGFFGWIREGSSASGGHFNQFNFFSAPKEEQEKFNTNFKAFLNEYYAK